VLMRQIKMGSKSENNTHQKHFGFYRYPALFVGEIYTDFLGANFSPKWKEGGYTVYVPALPGCISEGDTFEKAIANIKEAVELF